MDPDTKKQGEHAMDNNAFEGSLVEIKLKDEIPKTPKMIYDDGEHRRILKNVIIISVAFTLQFTAFNSMSSLQSSLNKNLGNDSNAVVYGSLVLSCVLLPTYVIRKLTAKWTIVFSVFGYSIFMAAQFKPEYYTLMPTAVLVGLCGAPLWSAKCTYLTHVGHQYAAIIGDKAEVIITRFFGIFFLFFQTSHIWGNLLASFVLARPEDGEEIVKNITICGSSFCPEDVSSGNIRPVSDVARYILAGSFLASSLAASAVVSIFVDSLTRYGEKEREGSSSKLEGVGLFLASAKQAIIPYQILLIPITIWSGLEQGFFVSDYTQAYVSCSWDVSKVGFVLICYGCCDAIASVSFGPVVRRISRVPVFIFGGLLNVATIVVLFLWKPDPDTPVLFFVVAGLWGISDAVWQTQINALYGVLFSHNEEPSFANYRLWESLGFILAFVAANKLCIDVKLYCLSAALFLGMAGYLTVELLEFRKNKTKQHH